jgi:hypothetical protein
VVTTAFLTILLATAASAHGYIVVGTVDVTPNPPRPGHTMTVTVQLQSTTRATVTGADLLAKLRPGGAQDTTPLATFQLAPEADAGGTYQGSITAPSVGAYTLTFEDHTYPHEHITADVPLSVGGTQPDGTLDFVFPPTKRAGIATWILWILGPPLATGAGAWLLVRRSNTKARARRDA